MVLWDVKRSIMGLACIELLTIGILSVLRITAGGSCSAAKLCCEGRDSGCVIQKASPNAIIESPQDKPCYCDHACLRLNDCCHDFRDTCQVVDCAVGEWEDWSPCGNRCGAGVQTRTRSIVQPTTNGGKHCPQLEQSRTCQSFAGCHREARIFHLKGTEICAICRPNVGASRCLGNGNQHDGPGGIGRWKMMTSKSTNCHGKWIGGTNVSSQCNSVLSCRDATRRLVFV